MSTTFDWKSLIGVVELAGQVATGILLPGGGAIAQLEAGLEQAINPFLMSIGTKQSAAAETMTVYATIIGILTTLKAVPGLPADTLTKINDYLIAAQNGTAAYIQGALGYDPASHDAVTPIV